MSSSRDQREMIVQDLSGTLEYISSSRANSDILDPNLPVDAIEMLEMFEDLYTGYDTDRELTERDTLGVNFSRDLLLRLAAFYANLKQLFVPRRASTFDATLLGTQQWQDMQRQAAALAGEIANFNID